MTTEWGLIITPGNNAIEAALVSDYGDYKVFKKAVLLT
jgi:hypothetical protein